MKRLYEVKVGNDAVIEKLLAKDLLKERLLALGLTKGASVQVIRKGPADNLTIYRIRGSMIALRKEEAQLIYVS